MFTSARTCTRPGCTPRSSYSPRSSISAESKPRLSWPSGCALMVSVFSSPGRKPVTVPRMVRPAPTASTTPSMRSLSATSNSSVALLLATCPVSRYLPAVRLRNENSPASPVAALKPEKSPTRNNPAYPLIGVTPSAPVSRPAIEPPVASPISSGGVSSATTTSTSRLAWSFALTSSVTRPAGTPFRTNEPSFADVTRGRMRQLPAKRAVSASRKPMFADAIPACDDWS